MYKILLVFILIISNLLASKTLEKVSLQLKWKYQFQFAGFIMAKEKGFYKDAGLDVEIKELNSPIDIVGDVLNGVSTFGVSDSSLIYNRLHGKKVTALMPIFQESPFILLGLKNKKIKSLDDLNGKTIAMHEGVDGISIKAMLKAKEISYKAHPPVFNFDKLLKKQIDLKTSYISNEPFLAKEKGIDIVTYLPKDYGFLGYGDILFTSDKTVSKNPQLVQKFYEATKKGWEYAFSNMGESVNLLYENYNTLKKTKRALIYESRILKNLSGINNNFGEFKKEKVEGIAQQFNLVKNEHNLLSSLDGFIYKPLKKRLKVCYSNDMKPYNFIQNGEARGFGIDFLKLIEKNSDLSFDYNGEEGNRGDIRLLKEGKCDIVPTVVTNVNARDFMNITIPYGDEYLAVATSIQESFIKDLSKFKNKKIGFNKKYKNAYLYTKELFPDLDFILLDQKTAIKHLEKGKIEAYLDGYMFLVNEIKHNYYGKLKVNNIIYQSKYEIGFGVDRDNKRLLDKLNEEIKKLPEDKKEEILYKWRHIEVKKEVDYTLVIEIILISVMLLAIITMIYLRDQKQKKEIIKLNKTLESRVQEELEKNRKKEKMMLHQSRLAQMGEMISMIAHQWRQPLNNLSVLNQTVILKYRIGKLDDKAVDEFKENSKKQIHQMSQTIDDFSNFFRPDKEKAEFFIDKSIENIMEIFKVMFEKNNITVIVNMDRDIKLISYENEFSQALVNILKNAKDALIENEIEDKIILIDLEKLEKNIILTIQDSAGGIQESIIDKIFDPYFSTKDEKNGTGLGLYMTKIIIDDHLDGEIMVRNNKFVYEQNRYTGAQFGIKLPL
jgi:signal transduction histidine kinase/ABC-type nitrate/sulfonate/bicarbonate transport system substrate-binding protein